MDTRDEEKQSLKENEAINTGIRMDDNTDNIDADKAIANIIDPASSTQQLLLQSKLDNLNLSDKLNQYCLEHEKATDESAKLIAHLSIVSFSLTFTYYLRNNIVLLYMESLEYNVPEKHLTYYLGLITYFTYLWFGISSFLFGILGDMWRFDLLIIFLCIFDVITFWIEATTEDFITMAVVYVFGGQPTFTVICAYTIKYLPLYYSQKAQMYITQLSVFALLFAPVISGLISTYINYRTVFKVAAVMASVICAYSMLMLRNNETRLREIQSKFYQIYFDEENMRLFEQYKDNIESLLLSIAPKNSAKNNKNNKNDSVNENLNEVDSGELAGSSGDLDLLDSKEIVRIKWMVLDDYKFSMLLNQHRDELLLKNSNKKRNACEKIFDGFADMPKYHIFLLFMIILLQAIVIASELALITWWTYYVEQKYDGTVLYATCMYAYGSAVSMVAGGAWLVFQKRMQQRKDDADVTISQINANAMNDNNSDETDTQTTDLAIDFNNSDINNTNNGNKYWIHGNNRYDFRHYCIVVVLIVNVIRVILCTFVIPNNLGDIADYRKMYFLYWFLYMPCVNSTYMASTVLMVPLLPPRVTGQWMGFKDLITYGIVAASAYMIGQLWDYNIDWMWWSAAVMAAIAFVLTFIIAAFESSSLHVPFANTQRKL